jgi:hypothetical protein
MRKTAVQRRRKGVEFTVVQGSSSFFYYRKRNLIDPKPRSKADDISAKA